MKTVLWQVLAGTEGGPNRVRILRALDEQPRNRHRLADALSLNYKTVEHHLAVLSDHGLVDCTDTDYGAVYFLTPTADEHWSVIEDIASTVDSG